MFQARALTRVAPLPCRARRAAEDDPTIESAGAEMVSLEEVEAGEAEKDIPIEDESTSARTCADDDTFLEEEEEGEDDVGTSSTATSRTTRHRGRRRGRQDGS